MTAIGAGARIPTLDLSVAGAEVSEFDSTKHKVVQIAMGPEGGPGSILHTVIMDKDPIRDYSKMPLTTLSNLVTFGTLELVKKVVTFLAKVGLRPASIPLDEHIRADLQNVFEKSRSKESVKLDCKKLAEIESDLKTADIATYAHLHGTILDNPSTNYYYPLESLGSHAPFEYVDGPGSAFRLVGRAELRRRELGILS